MTRRTETTSLSAGPWRVAYRVGGNGPVTVVFLHRWAGSGTGSGWRRVIERLDPGAVRTVEIDLPGHGQSSALGMPWTTAAIVHGIWSVIDSLGANRPVLVGSSLGARLALCMSICEPERVAGQVLLTPIPLEAFEIPEDVIEQWVADTHGRAEWRHFLQAHFARPVTDDEVDDSFADAFQASDDAKRQALVWCGRPATDSTARCRVPTTVVGGQHDQIASTSTIAERILPRLESHTLVILDGAHDLPLELPEAVATHIDSLVAQIADVDRFSIER